MEIEEKKINEMILLKLSGRIDAYTSERLEEELDSIINSGKCKFVVNFENVKYISSAGLRVFLGAHKKVFDSGGKIKFSQMPDHVLKIFTLAGFDKIFDIHAGDKEALQEFTLPTKKAA